MNDGVGGSVRPRGLGDIRRKPVALADVPLVKSRQLFDDKPFLKIYEPTSSDVDVVEWVGHNREKLDAELLVHGAIMLRGFGIKSVTDFEKVAETFYNGLYGGYGDLPRAGTSEQIYQSTPYPPDKPILYHQESSHLNSWPQRIGFCCLQKAPVGGITPLLDCRAICDKIDPEIFAKFKEKGLKYVRTFSEGIDVSWQQFFHTDDKSVVEQMCRDAEVEYEWIPNDGLKMSQNTHAVVRHPRTGDEIFFNQVQLHHIYWLDEDVRNSLISLFGKEYLPRNVYYGDGTEIEDSVMEHLGNVFEENAVRADWQEGDIIFLDNMLTSHARDPYEGPRRIVVAMGQMMSKKDLPA